MMKFIFACLWYLLPAALGNHNASLGNRIWLPAFMKNALARLAVPVDLGRKWNGREILGKNKTWRGILVGSVTGVIVAGVQALLFSSVQFFRDNTFIDYSRVNFAVSGFLMGCGALTGDLVKSLVKRALNKPSGKPWFPWDQLDWIIGAMVFSSLVYMPSVRAAAVTAILYVGVHLCSDRVVYLMGIKKREEVN